MARGLDPDLYEVKLATGPDFRSFVEQAGIDVLDLWAIGTRAYLATVAAGRPVFPYRILCRYVEEDRQIIEAVQPDLVVGDFRLSLAVSARLAHIPYVAISNAYWCPFTPVRFEVPVHPLTRWLGPQVVDRVFQRIYPLIFAQHSLPMHRLRRRYGMPSLGFDLRNVFTEADKTLFADVPSLVPTKDAGQVGRYEYLGPITWEPDIPLPEELTENPDRRPLVYINLGSSGDPNLLQTVVSAVDSLGVRIAVATGGAVLQGSYPKDSVIRSLLPGGRLAELAQLVICNGGSPCTHQALRHACPVLGLPANLDQLLNMQFIAASGAGLSLRADRITSGNLSDALDRLLREPSFVVNAGHVADEFHLYCAVERFADIIQKTMM